MKGYQEWARLELGDERSPGQGGTPLSASGRPAGVRGRAGSLLCSPSVLFSERSPFSNIHIPLFAILYGHFNMAQLYEVRGAQRSITAVMELHMSRPP